MKLSPQVVNVLALFVIGFLLFWSYIFLIVMCAWGCAIYEFPFPGILTLSTCFFFLAFLFCIYRIIRQPRIDKQASEENDTVKIPTNEHKGIPRRYQGPDWS